MHPQPGRLFVRLRVVHKDTAAIFAHDKFLAQTDVGLTLRRNMVEAAAARITLYRNHGQTVAHAVADTLIGGQQPLVDTRLGLLGLLRKGGNLIRRLGLDALQLRFLVVEIHRAVGYDGLGIFQLSLLLLDARSVLLQALLGQFDLQCCAL